MPAQMGTMITMPQLGESVTEGTIGNWLKQVGDRIDKYEPLVEVETDKASAEIPAPLAGVLAEILIEPGTTVPVGAELCRIAESAGIGETSSHSPLIPNASAQNGHAATFARDREGRASGSIPNEAHLLHTRSSPVVRRLAEEHGVDITQIQGSGAEGRVTKKDILAFIAQGATAEADTTITLPADGNAGAAPAMPEPAAPPVTMPISEPVRESRGIAVLPGDQVMPVTGMRRRIAEHMVTSVTTAPQATVVMEVDMTNAVASREAHKDSFRAREGVGLTYLPFVIKAVTTALKDHPRLNAVWDEERIIQRHALNIGVAVGLDDGLVVPIIRNADRLSIAGLAVAVDELATKVRTGDFSADDLVGGTFTVNNPGTFGSLVSTPILLPPQVAILSTEAIIKRPVVIGDMIAIRSMMNLSLTIDHRALDGLAATRFLRQVRLWLERIDNDLPLY